MSSVEAHSSEPEKELGLRDLVLQEIVYVVGAIWIGTAATLGHQHFAFWIAAIVLSHLPQAAVVIDLTRRMPLEGGLYQWARLGLSELMGFWVAWNLWIYAVASIATIGLVVGTNVVGPGGEWLARNKLFLMALNIILIIGLMMMATRGLWLSKWLVNIGSISYMTAFAVMIALPFALPFGYRTGTLPDAHPFAVAMPAFGLLSLNIFGNARRRRGVVLA